MAELLSRKGQALDLAWPDDQDTMIGKLYSKFVTAMKTCIGFALRLDKGWDEQGEDALPTLGERIAADMLSDPGKLLEHHELPHQLKQACEESYSQATAYVVCLYQWSNYNSLATYLCVRVGTLHGRVRFWGQWVKWQPSLFDGIERIPFDFTPQQGRIIVSSSLIYLDGQQHAWMF